MSLNKHFFYTAFTVYVLLGIYMLGVTYVTPFVDIQLEEVDGDWIIAEPMHKEWANAQRIQVGDVVLAIDGVSTQQLSYLHYSPHIRGANKLSIAKQDGTIMQVVVHHLDIPRQFYLQVVMPSLYFLLTIGTALFLSIRKASLQQVGHLILFLLAVSMAYISSGASARMNVLGILVNSSFLILSLVLLLHFLQNYFQYLHVKWLFIERLTIFYTLPLIAIVFRLIRWEQPEFSPIDMFVILILFLLLLVLILYILIRGYVRYRLSQLKILFISLVAPFLPFLLLYVLPMLVWKRPLLQADLCALCLLLIPFNMICLKLTDRLFDLMYHISRFRYYFLMALLFTGWLIGGMALVAGLSSPKLVGLAFFCFFSIFAFLYIKEKIDYRGRKILFSAKGQHIHTLYQTIEKLEKSTHVKQVEQLLIEEVMHHLEVKEVTVITEELTTGVKKSTNGQLYEIESMADLSIGEIVKTNQVYFMLIHRDMHCQRGLVIAHHGTIRLKTEEKLWLELLLMYTNTFIESTKVIEGLIEELQQLQHKDGQVPTWLKKLIWLRIDQETFQFAQELHDTFLQEHLHIARQLDCLMAQTDVQTVQLELVQLHCQMIHSIDNLRAYCETLKPPLLIHTGLNAALERLVERTEERASFVIKSTFERLYLEDEQLILAIYRIVQELLNNAVKHAQATILELSIEEFENGFQMTYRDDGVGFDVQRQSESLGLQGIKDRVEAFNGTLEMTAQPGKGVWMQIQIMEGSDVLDFDTDYRRSSNRTRGLEAFIK